MKANIKLVLGRLTPVRLLALLTNVAAKLTGSSLYPTPPVSADEMNVLARQLEDAIELATDGSRASKAARDARVAEVAAVLRQTANYVRIVAQGDLEMLTQSGFPIAKQPTPVGMIGTPLLTEARMTGMPGEVDLRWTGVYGRRAYHVYVTDQDPAGNNPNWTLTGVTSKTRFMADSLVPYKAYWFCVSAIGSVGEGVKSDPIIARAA